MLRPASVVYCDVIDKSQLRAYTEKQIVLLDWRCRLVFIVRQGSIMPRLPVRFDGHTLLRKTIVWEIGLIIRLIYGKWPVHGNPLFLQWKRCILCVAQLIDVTGHISSRQPTGRTYIDGVILFLVNGHELHVCRKNDIIFEFLYSAASLLLTKSVLRHVVIDRLIIISIACVSYIR